MRRRKETMGKKNVEKKIRNKERMKKTKDRK